MSVLKVGVQRNTPPFCFTTGDAVDPVGYSIDLMYAVVARLNRESDSAVRVSGIEFVEVTSSDREKALLSGDIDVECGSTSITKSRMERVAFSVPIFQTSHAIVVKEFSPRVPPLLLTGIAGSTSAESLAGAVGLDARFSGESSIGDSFNRFVSDDNVDGLVADEVILRSLISRASLRSIRLLELNLGADSYGFMFRLEDFELRRGFDRALKEVIDSSEWLSMLEKWFSEYSEDLGTSLDMGSSLAKVVEGVRKVAFQDE